MNYHPDVISNAFRRLDIRLRGNPKGMANIHNLASEVAVDFGIRIIDFFELVEKEYDVDLSEDIKELKKFYGE